MAIEAYFIHAEHNKTYREFLKHSNRLHLKPKNWQEIPCLPIDFFKSRNISLQNYTEKVFTSSGTSGQTVSKHHITSLDWYHRVCEEAFTLAYGPLSNYQFRCLLPSYLERSGSSLVEMCRHFIEKSGGDFYLYKEDELLEDLLRDEKSNKKTILIGVSFALLDMASKLDGKAHFTKLIVMETGGMKGRRKEMIRPELHEEIKKGFGAVPVHSEYGMTELLSQAYAQTDGYFSTPPWMKVYTRDVTDPFSVQKSGKSGILNIIDLANIESMPFISTQDLGKVYESGIFEVLGRYDQAEVRGCNLMVD